MTATQMTDILSRKIAATQDDIAAKTAAIIASATRADMSTSAVQQLTGDLAALRVRLATLQEMATLVAG